MDNYTSITSGHQHGENDISISFTASKKKLDRLDPSFIYTQILKEILSTINFEDKHFEEFITYCRTTIGKTITDLNIIEAFRRGYDKKEAIKWYTSECFLYTMLNQALRSMDVDIIVRMGFFINDLHRHIQELHSNQFGSQQSGKTFTVYRGQCLSNEDFDEMINNKGGLLSFNNFLSTSTKRDVSLFFAPQDATNSELTGILFVISINPTDSTATFASIRHVSHHDVEDEILFSMHTIFRIGDIKPTKENKHVQEVNLTLTRDTDEERLTLTKRILQETCPNSNGWYRLGQLLIQMGQSDKAEEVYEDLLSQATHESDKASIYHQLGWNKYNQGNYEAALTHYKKTLDIYQQLSLPNHLELANTCNNIGLVYHNLNDWYMALYHLEFALGIRLDSLSQNHLDLAISHNNIGLVYYKKCFYYTALYHCKLALKIRQQLPANHPDLGTSHNNIGLVYFSIHYYREALNHLELALAIRLESLLSNHLDLGASYNNIGLVHEKMGNYSEAHSFYERAVQNGQEPLSSDHQILQQRKENLERLKKKL
ncbi:unnamed protein product [Adineta steineri]|uniref:ADP ribosyltransferase domain-containing protein n=1 Tax=Adineta steineri TaxID=433720 RepID=A0A813Q005_9BILA|nr:unnamed protein product [Adineta steineri]CAF0769575.1 unnamed protein product [Adineta steineri]CAF0814824.1 unnamed protein product [Adineta steineri]